jgi:hypothetical protein
MRITPTRFLALVVGALLMGVLAATPAQAGTKCGRYKQGAGCRVSYYIFPSTTDTLRFEIRNNYAGLERRRNYVYTDRGWLDSDNDRDHSHWKGHVGRAGKFYWRGWAKYWRACTEATRPHFACTPWVGQGPRPLGSPFDILPR